MPHAFPRALLLPILATGLALAQPAVKRPKLVLVISVDQLSEDLMQRYEGRFTGGFRRLRKEGVYFSEAYHDHAITETAPGHSVLLTGRTPGHTGIPENQWYDRASGRTVYCVADETTTLVGLPGKTGSSNKALLGDALGDWLQAQVPGSRVFSLSGKDRAAILMAGRKPTSVYWFEGAYGFTTSTHYSATLPPWLQAFDVDLQARFRQEVWMWRPFHVAGSEGRTATFTFPDGSTFISGHLPRVVQGLGMPVDPGFTSRLRASPLFDQITFEGAKAMIEGEGIGQGKATDLLTLSLSATDYVGHAFGAGSPEMEDNLERLDERLGAFLDWLHARVPEMWVVLTADHGGMDLVERLQGGGFGAKRLDPKAWLASINDKVREDLHLSQAPLLPTYEPLQLILDPRATAGSSVTRGEVLQAVVATVKAKPEVLEVATAEQLEAFKETDLGSPRDNPVFARMKHSFNPPRSGDILVAFKPLIDPVSPKPFYIAEHGSPHDYDRRVPLLFWGPWRAAERREPVRTIDLAPTLARALGLRPSADVDGKAIELTVTVPSSFTRSHP